MMRKACRILRLEPLETRNLLASMPWAHALPMDPHHGGPDFLANGRGPMVEMGPASQQSGAREHSFALGPGTGFRPPAPHVRDRLAGPRRDNEILVQTAPPRESLLAATPANQIGPPAVGARPRLLAENDDASPRPKSSLANADSLTQAVRLTLDAEATVSLVFVVTRIVPGNVAENPRTAGASASPRDSNSSSVPANTGAALSQFEARHDPPQASPNPGRLGAAAPTPPNDDAVTFDFANPGAPTSPPDGPAFARDEFGPFLVPSQPANAATQLEQVMRELFLDSGHADSQRGLDELLDTLLQENTSTSKQDAGLENPAQDLEPASQPRWSQPEVSQVNPSWLQGGMIAMGLPRDQWFSDPLLKQSLPIDVELMRDQSRAWTASVELYRSHELALVTKATATGNGLEQVSKESSGSAASRLRPLLALSSVAIGAIFIGLRRHRQSAQRREQADQKLV